MKSNKSQENAWKRCQGPRVAAGGRRSRLWAASVGFSVVKFLQGYLGGQSSCLHEVWLRGCGTRDTGVGQAGPGPCSAIGNGMCWILLQIPFKPWCLGAGAEPRGCPRSVGCQRWGLGRTGVAKWGNGPWWGRAPRAEPSPGPGRGCHSLYSM